MVSRCLSRERGRTMSWAWSPTQAEAATTTLQIQEKRAASLPGIPLLLLFILLLVGGTLALVLGATTAGIVVDIATLILAAGLVPLPPGGGPGINTFGPPGGRGH